VAERSATLRDFVIFQVKLALDGLTSVIILQVSIFAVVVDVIAGKGRRPRWFYSVVGWSERFDRWLNLYGAVERLEAGETEDGLFGASDAGADSLLGKIEEVVRGGDEPRRRRRPR
jgi:hypothetical protein